MRLTNGGDDSDGKVKRAGELPLHASAVRLSLHDDALQLAVVVLADVVFALEPLLLGFQLLLLAHLVVRLERVEHGGTHQQIRERAHDQGQGAHVLPLHGRQEAASEGLMSPRLPRGAAARVERLTLSPRLLLVLVVRGQTQKAAGAPRPRAPQPANPAQHPAEASPAGAQCHPQPTAARKRKGFLKDSPRGGSDLAAASVLRVRFRKGTRKSYPALLYGNWLLWLKGKL